MKLKKAAALFIMFIFSFSILFSCTNNNPKTTCALKIGEKEYPETLFSFFANFTRDYIYQNFVSYYGPDGFEKYLNYETDDTGSYMWEYILNQTKDSVLEYAYNDETFERLGLSFTEEEQSAIDKSFESMISEYTSSYGEEILNNIYSKLKITKDDFKKFTAQNTAKTSKISNYYFGEGGPNEITNEKLTTFYNENYRRFKFCIFPKIDSTGKPLKVSELTEKGKTAQSVLELAQKEGTVFEDLIKDYSEYFEKITETMTDEEKESAQAQNDSLTKTGIICDSDGVFSNAYFQQTGSKVASEILSKLFQMNVGECALAELDEAFWVFKAYDINESKALFETKHDDIFNSLATPIYENILSEWKKKSDYIFKNEIVEKYDPRKLEAVFVNTDKLKEVYNAAKNKMEN